MAAPATCSSSSSWSSKLEEQCREARFHALSHDARRTPRVRQAAKADYEAERGATKAHQQGSIDHPSLRRSTLIFVVLGSVVAQTVTIHGTVQTSGSSSSGNRESQGRIK